MSEEANNMLLNKQYSKDFEDFQNFQNFHDFHVFLETLEHDGYDEDGPTSNLWDLYLVQVESTDEKSVIWHFHREEWFGWNTQGDQGDQGDKKKYRFVQKTSLAFLKKNPMVLDEDRQFSLSQKINLFRQNNHLC